MAGKFEKSVKTNVESRRSNSIAEDDQMQPPSPEILRADSRFSPPLAHPSSPPPEIRETRESLMRSPLFNRPTFRERFGGLPVNINDYQTSGRQTAIKQDQSQQTDNSFVRAILEHLKSLNVPIKI